MSDAAVFYSGTRNASSWAMRAWLALRAAAFPFTEIIVDIRAPQRFANLRCIGAFSPPAAVPVLVTDDHVIFESIAIMEFANDICGGELLPQNLRHRAEARALVAWQHAGLSRICERISFESSFFPYKRKLSEAEQTESGRLFAHLESILARSTGPYLFGAIGLADFMLVPTITRLTRHQADTEKFPRTRKWIDEILKDKHVVEWLEEADSLPHIWDDSYLLPNSQIEIQRWESSFGPGRIAYPLPSQPG